MKRRELEKKLRHAGCYLKREGGAHSLWINPRGSGISGLRANRGGFAFSPHNGTRPGSIHFRQRENHHQRRTECELCGLELDVRKVDPKELSAWLVFRKMNFDASIRLKRV